MKTQWTLVSAISMVILLAGCAKSPESTVESFYKAVGKGEITEAKKYLSSQLINTMGDAKLTNALSGVTSKISACGGIKSVDVKLEGEGEVRTGTAILTLKDDTCKQQTDKTKLIKENGSWKISPAK